MGRLSGAQFGLPQCQFGLSLCGDLLQSSLAAQSCQGLLRQQLSFFLAVRVEAQIDAEEYVSFANIKGVGDCEVCEVPDAGHPVQNFVFCSRRVSKDVVAGEPVLS